MKFLMTSANASVKANNFAFIKLHELFLYTILTKTHQFYFLFFKT